ncbi:MAG: acyl-CoA thioesterase [Planctomycetes bacterium]|nr:acyl-CoA thioesterase [Planctomycetota bacterium]
MPKDTNANGSIFGGVILSYIDQAGAIEARRHTGQKIVTVAMNKVEFKQPVYVGELVSFYTETLRVGRTSVTIKVSVVSDARRCDEIVRVPVTEAEITFVAIDDHGKPIPLATPMPGC